LNNFFPSFHITSLPDAFRKIPADGPERFFRLPAGDLTVDTKKTGEMSENRCSFPSIFSFRGPSVKLFFTNAE
jgi:hypothetical protein